MGATPIQQGLGDTASDRAFFGHPRGLSTLFFTEMWERFSYYGMRAILILFMTAAVTDGGLGMEPAESGPIFAMYTSLVYLVCIPGGWLADNFLGARKSVLYGGLIIMTGHICLAMHGILLFYIGLGCIVVGTGLLKPNISVMVGQLYTQADVRRDSGFSIFYMGINAGAFAAPLVCAWLAQSDQFKGMLAGWGLNPIDSWHFGFAAAAVGMGLGLLQYVRTGRYLGTAGERPAVPPSSEIVAGNKRTLMIGLGGLAVLIVAILLVAMSRPELMTRGNINTAYTIALFAVVFGVFAKLFLGGNWTAAERARISVVFVLFCAAAIFWGVFEQAGSTLSLFAEGSTDNRIFGREFPSGWWQSVNALLIVVLAPFFSWLWVRLGTRNPGYPAKFGIGLAFAGLGFLWLIGGANASLDGTKVGIHWLLGVYLLHTVGELFLSPVGLSAMTKLAPERVVGMMMGVWFLASSVGNFLGGSASGFYETLPLPKLFLMVGMSAMIMAAILFALVGPINRMLKARGLTSTGAAIT